MAGITIEAGTRVKVGAKAGQILYRVNSTEVMVDFDNGEKRIVAITKLKSPLDSTDRPPPLSETLNEKQHAATVKLMDALLPLARFYRIPEKLMAEKEKEVGLDRTNIRRRLNKWRETKSMFAFAPPIRPGGKGKWRLDPRTDAIITAKIESEYLTVQRISIKHLYKSIVAACNAVGAPKPNIKTVARRVAAIPGRNKVRKRSGYSEAHAIYELNKGTFPDATRILEVVQIDHTESDVILVDEVYYRPIGRATITAAIDVYTGMCVGLLVGLNKPSADVVGMCLFRCMMPKGEYLKSIGVDAVWPIWGTPYILHSDNGSDLRSHSLSESLRELDIQQRFRPVGAPRFGGHVESFMKLISDELHSLPGTTKASIEKRGNYDSEGRAVLTVRALEKILISKICVEYHNSPLNGGLTPLQHFDLAVKHENYFSDRFQRMYATYEEKEALRISLLPLKLVTVQKYGIRLNLLKYTDPILSRWVLQKNPTREDGKFIVRRDPTDYSPIYFLHPEKKRYFPIGFANPANPRISDPVYKEAYDALDKAQVGKKTEEALVAHIRLKQQIIIEETKKTRDAKRARRQAEASRTSPPDLQIRKNDPNKPRIPDRQPPQDDIKIKPFDEEDE